MTVCHCQVLIAHLLNFRILPAAMCNLFLDYALVFTPLFQVSSQIRKVEAFLTSADYARHLIEMMKYWPPPLLSAPEILRQLCVQVQGQASQVARTFHERRARNHHEIQRR